MNCVRVRPTTQIGCTDQSFDGGMSKGIYASKAAAAEDIILYLDYFKAPTSFSNVEAFSYWLKSVGYYTASYDNYTNGLRSWI